MHYSKASENEKTSETLKKILINKEGVMKKGLKITLFLIIFFLMISSIAFASFKVNATPIAECAFLMIQGIGMISLGSFLREAVKR